MRNEPPYLSQPSLLQYVICYAVWLVLSAMIIWLMVQLRLNLLDITLLLNLGPWAHLLIDRWGLVVLGILAMGAIVVLEHYLRTGLAKKRFWPRAAYAFFIMAIALAFSYAFLFGFRMLSSGGPP